MARVTRLNGVLRWFWRGEGAEHSTILLSSWDQGQAPNWVVMWLSFATKLVPKPVLKAASFFRHWDSLLPLMIVLTSMDREVDQEKLNNFQGVSGKVKKNVFWTGYFTLFCVSLFPFQLYLDIDHSSPLHSAMTFFL